MRRGFESGRKGGIIDLMRTSLPSPTLPAVRRLAGATAAALALVLSFAPGLRAQQGTTFGLSVGIRPLQRGYPESPSHMTGISAWTETHPAGILAFHIGLRYAAWEPVPTDALPMLPPSWWIRYEYLSDRVSGYEFGLVGGPAIHLARSRAFSAGLLTLAGVHSYCENRVYRLSPDGDINPPPENPIRNQSHIHNRGRCIVASLELRLRLAFGPSPSSPALEVGRVWSRGRWELSDNAPATVPATGYLIALTAPPPTLRSRSTSAPPLASLGSRYLRGVRGTALGLLGGTVVYVFTQTASGVEQIGGSAYSGFIPLGGIVGSVLAAPGYDRAGPAAYVCRLLGGLMAAHTHSWVMRTRFGVDMPDPLLAFTLPIGTVLIR
jgi:hypothetical protein